MRQSIFLYSGIVLLFGAGWVMSAPLDFQPGTVVEVESGAPLKQTARKLEDAKIVRSDWWLRTLFWAVGREKDVKYGRYIFKTAPTMPRVIIRMVRGEHGFGTARVLIPEGTNNIKIAESLDAKLELFDKDKFLELASTSQGYLFPDTYFISLGASEKEIFQLLTSNFKLQVGAVGDDDIRMGALLEGEVQSTRDRQLVAGILWKRLKAGWLLQVDAAPTTYRERGLPAPINNPGLDAISAAQDPTESPYWFYLTDKAGNVHYARTFEEHKSNVRRYLGR